MLWYYASGGEQHGPIEEDELRAVARDGRLRPDDLVWNESMGDKWRRAGDVAGLCAAAAPPPVPGAPAPAIRVAAAGNISCTLAVAPAWRQMMAMLFRPFSMAKWFGLGASAWLASLGQNQGGALNWGGGGNWGSGKRGEVPLPDKADVDRLLSAAREFLAQHGGTVAVAVVAAVVVALAFGLLMLWIRSRGQFVFLDNVVNDRSEISAPWRAFAQHGNSLFWWNVGYSAVCLAAAVPIAGIALMGGVLPIVRAGGMLSSALQVLFLAGFLALVLSILMGYVARFREDFVVPIMYRFDLTATEAWRRFLPLLKRRFGGFVLYGLFYVALMAAAGACVLVFVVVTCCIAGCLMAIPVVGTVVILPVPVFFRAYSLAYLGQFGPDFVLAPEEPAAAQPPSGQP